MSDDAHTARTVVGIMGNVISFGLFCSPIQTMLKIRKMKSVSEFKPDPYVATVLNCAMWTFYALPFVQPDSILILTINSTGLFLELVYVTIFFTFASSPVRRKIAIAMTIEVIFLASVIICTLHFLHTTKQRSMLIGILCVIFTILMYAAPLTVMKRVVETKSVKFLPLFLSVATLMNGVVWITYACLKFDPYMLIPNILGTLSGIVQLVLYVKYYKTTNWNDEDDDRDRPYSNSEIEAGRT